MRRTRLFWIRRRYERSRLGKIDRFEPAVEPGAKVPRHSQLVEGIAMVALDIVSGRVARLAQPVEQVADFAGE